MTNEVYLGVKIDLTRDDRFSEQGLSLVQKFYMLPHETSPQHSFARAATCYSFGDLELAQRIYDYVSKGWFGFASPVLSNASEIDWSKLPTKPWVWRETYDEKRDQVDWIKSQIKSKGLPISCFLTYVADTLESLIAHSTETRWLSVKGGGVGGHWSDVRSVSDIAPGPVPFMKTIDSDMIAYRQGRTRKGSYAAYLDVSHPEVLEFTTLRIPNGDTERKCLSLNNAVNFGDDFIDAILHDKEWNLVDPKDRTIRETVTARGLWQQLLETRNRTGEPYLCYVSEANKQMPNWLKSAGLKINGSNLCSEIFLPTSDDRTAVCCLSSANLEFYDDWKNTTMVADLIRFLDNVLEVFIILAPKELKKATYSAQQERSLGLGVMGWHAFLQKRDIPWEGALAKSANLQVFRNIRERAEEETLAMSLTRGSAPDCFTFGVLRRNSHLLALAPTANNSIISNTSPGIEPRSSNAVVHKTRVGTHLIKNRFLQAKLEKYATELKEDEVWIEKQWQSIISNEGSVLHLAFMNDYDKDVFKTAFEIDQRWVVDHARDRQEFIDQGQSVNLFFPSMPDKGYVNQVHLRAFLPEGSATGRPLKSLYYYRTKSVRNGEKVGQKVERLELKNGVVEGTECLSCEG